MLLQFLFLRLLLRCFMKRRANRSVATLLILSLMVYGPFRAGTGEIGSTGGSNAALAQENYSEDELNELLAPIALYPDPLLAQVLPASTFVEQLDAASRTLGGRVDENLIERQNWDVSVKSIAHYPQVLQMMTQNKDWTIALGQAVVNQSTDVMKAIQRLRAEAKAAGNLSSNDKMTVTEESQEGRQVITIEPAQPQVIYVPQYNPSVVYEDRGVSTGGVIASSLISFGAGFAIGSWLNRGFNWWGWGFPYHGWVGGGWIARSRPFVNTHNNFYVNNRYRNSNLNRNVLRRDISGYRGELRRDAISHRQRYSRGPMGRPSDIKRPAMDTRDLKRPAGRPSDIRRPAMDMHDLKRPAGRPSDIKRPADIKRPVPTVRPSDIKRPVMDTHDLKRPMGRPSDIKRPGVGTRDMPRPGAGPRDIRRPSGLGSNPAFGGRPGAGDMRIQRGRSAGSHMRINRGGSGGARMDRGGFGGARAGKGGFSGGGRRGGFGGGRGRRH